MAEELTLEKFEEAYNSLPERIRSVEHITRSVH